MLAHTLSYNDTRATHICSDQHDNGEQHRLQHYLPTNRCRRARGNKVGANCKSLSSFRAQLPLAVLTERSVFSNSVKGHRKAQYCRYVHSTPHLFLTETQFYRSGRNISSVVIVAVIVVVSVTLLHSVTPIFIPPNNNSQDV
jgi:hypothetical protein